jgi:hypothetical protein
MRNPPRNRSGEIIEPNNPQYSGLFYLVKFKKIRIFV